MDMIESFNQRLESFNQRHSLSEAIDIERLINASHEKRICLSLTRKNSGTYLTTDWMHFENGILMDHDGVVGDDVASIKKYLEQFHINQIG